MLLSPSANRAKSWTCEHCPNWIEKDKSFCQRCFWAYPESYDHIAGRIEKLVPLIFTGNEIEDYNKLIKLSGAKSAQETIKGIIHKHLEKI
jgi:ribosome biogenesis protein Tsr3